MFRISGGGNTGQREYFWNILGNCHGQEIELQIGLQVESSYFIHSNHSNQMVSSQIYNELDCKRKFSCANQLRKIGDENELKIEPKLVSSNFIHFIHLNHFNHSNQSNHVVSNQIQFDFKNQKVNLCANHLVKIGHVNELKTDSKVDQAISFI